MSADDGAHTQKLKHVAIQSVFELDDDHAYAFYLNNRAWDPTFEYGKSMYSTVRPRGMPTIAFRACD